MQTGVFSEGFKQEYTFLFGGPLISTGNVYYWRLILQIPDDCETLQTEVMAHQEHAGLFKTPRSSGNIVIKAHSATLS